MRNLNSEGRTADSMARFRGRRVGARKRACVGGMMFGCRNKHGTPYHPGSASHRTWEGRRCIQTVYVRLPALDNDNQFVAPELRVPARTGLNRERGRWKMQPATSVTDARGRKRVREGTRTCSLMVHFETEACESLLHETRTIDMLA